MVELILCQILASVRNSVWVCMADHHDGLMDSWHVLLHGFSLLLPNLIQEANHHVILAHITKYTVHPLQQLCHHQVWAPIQGMHPLARISPQAIVDVWHHTLFLVLVQPASIIKAPHGIGDICVWVSRLENWHIQVCRCQPLLSMPLSPAVMAAWCLAHHGVPI